MALAVCRISTLQNTAIPRIMSCTTRVAMATPRIHLPITVRTVQRFVAVNKTDLL